jgi:hypothetical protein
MEKKTFPIPEFIQERRLIKDALAKKNDYDVHRFAQYIRKAEKEYLSSKLTQHVKN